MKTKLVCGWCEPSPENPEVEHPELCSIIYCEKCKRETYHYPTFDFPTIQRNIESGLAKCVAFDECNLKVKVGCNDCLYYKERLSYIIT